jgi:two-component system, chemotaxis family, protein-glutamate methylesterase/glutaminase
LNSNKASVLRDLVVVGGSAGSFQALQTILAGLPGDYQGAILIAVHTAANSPALLDAALSQVSPLPCRYAVDAETIRKQHVYLAPPDRHLIVSDNLIRVVFGPKQNWHRPAINPLFLSAAKAKGPRVVGVILSGMLDDGTIGLLAVREAGGTTIIQSPGDASYPAMPQNALEYVDADYTVPAAVIPDILVALGREPADDLPVSERASRSAQLTQEDAAMLSWMGEKQEPTALTCPECGGALSQGTTTGVLHYYCFLGHGYTSESLWNEGFVRAEQTLWLALRTREESVALGERLMGPAREAGNAERVLELSSGLARLERHAEKVRSILHDQES